jgi:hypothetical protein
MAIKKCVAMWLEVTYDSQVTNRKQVGIPVRAPLSRPPPIGRLGVIYDFQPAEIHKNTTTNMCYVLLFYLKIAQNSIFYI